MLKLLITLVFFLLYGSIAFTQQSIVYDWATSYGSDYSSLVDRGEAITSDSLGNIYVFGVYHDSMDVDPGPGQEWIYLNSITPTSGGIYVQKLDPNGNFIWGYDIDAYAGRDAIDIDVDGDGNVYLFIEANKYIDIDLGPGVSILGNSGTADGFIIKLDPNGNTIWGKWLRGAAGQISVYGAMDVDSNGDLYITGGFDGTIDFDPDPSTDYYLADLGNTTGFALKLDSAGTFIYAKIYGGTGPMESRDIAYSPNGECAITGFFYLTADFDPGPGVVNQTAVQSCDVFILKLDANGDYMWSQTFGGTVSFDRGYALDFDPSGNLDVACTFRGDVDFDYGPNTYMMSAPTLPNWDDIAILELDPNGSLLWVGRLPQTGWLNLECDNAGNVYVGFLSFYGTHDLNPNAAVEDHTAVGQDCALVKMCDNGSFLWAEYYGNDTDPYINAMDVSLSGNIHTTGYIQTPGDFDPGAAVSNLTVNGLGSAYVAKFNQTGSENCCIPEQGPTTTVTACDSFIWNGYVYTNTTYATATTSNAQGCDVYEYLDLTISNDASVTVSGGTITAVTSGAQYQWLDCNNSMSQITGANGQSYTPASNGSYAVVITAGGCSDTSVCTTINNVGFGALINLESRIFPNPTSGIVNIDNSYNDIRAIKLTNSIGQELGTFNEPEEKIQLNLESLMSGLYYLILINDEGCRQVPIIKN